MRLRTRLFRIARYAIAFLGMICAPFKKRSKEIVILMYHRVNDDINKGLAVKKDRFLWQMNYLKRNNYKVITMNEALSRILSNTIDEKYIVLTFDDGYEDYYYDAFPLLKKYNFPSTLYIVPGYVETGKVFWWDNDQGESRLMTWEQLQNLSRDNLIDFGSHTLNHADLNSLNSEGLKYELEKSKRILEEKLEREIIHFSYPRGIFSKEAEKIAGEIYSTGVLIFNGIEVNEKLSPGDLLKLKRTPVENTDNNFIFISRIRGWLKLEEKVRKKPGIN